MPETRLIGGPLAGETRDLHPTIPTALPYRCGIGDHDHYAIAYYAPDGTIRESWCPGDSPIAEVAPDDLGPYAFEGDASIAWANLAEANRALVAAHRALVVATLHRFSEALDNLADTLEEHTR